MLLNEEKLILNFSLFNNWEEKYEYLIELGGDICLIDPDKKTSKYLIQGCQSKVWLDFEFKNDKLYFYGDSDALISKGLVALIIELYSGNSPKEILTYQDSFFEKINLKEHLSMTRSNGLNMMIKKIKKHAYEQLNKNG